MADDDSGARIGLPGTPTATACPRDGDSWSARRAAAGRAPENSTAASDTRMRQPPESSEVGPSCRSLSKAEALEDGGSARFGGMRQSISVKAECGCRRSGADRSPPSALREQRRPLLSAPSAPRPARRYLARHRFLRHCADAGLAVDLDRYFTARARYGTGSGGDSVVLPVAVLAPRTRSWTRRGAPVRHSRTGENPGCARKKVVLMGYSIIVVPRAGAEKTQS